MREMKLRDVEAKLSAVADEAAVGEATIITRDGQPEAGFAEWQRLANVPSFAQLLVSIPLEADFEFERDDRPLKSFSERNRNFLAAPSPFGRGSG